MKKILIISLIFCLFLVGSVFAQETIQDRNQEEIFVERKEIVVENDFVKQDDLIKFQRDSIWQLTVINISLLTICIAVILFSGGLFFLFNFKSLEKKISEHERKLELLEIELIKKQKAASWLKLNKEKLEVKIIGAPTLEEVAPPVDILSIFEFYSR